MGETVNPLFFSWYKQLPVRYAIAKTTYNRETAFLIRRGWGDLSRYSLRMIKCHSTQHFGLYWDYVVKAEKHQIPYSIYYSLAKYKNGIPNQSLKLKERDNSQWMQNHYEHMESFDFVIDIDSDGRIDLAVESAILLIDAIKKTYTYEIRFSGRGFHIFIDLQIGFIPFNPNVENNVYQYHHQIAKMYHDTITEMIDTDIYDSRRVIKVPFSLAVYPEDDNLYVCTPITYDELKTFKLSDYILTEQNMDAWIKKAGEYSRK